MQNQKCKQDEQLQPKFQFKIVSERQEQVFSLHGQTNAQGKQNRSMTFLKVLLDSLSNIYFREADLNKDNQFKKLIQKYSLFYEIHEMQILFYGANQRHLKNQQIQDLTKQLKEYLENQKIIILSGTELHKNDLCRYLNEKIYLEKSFKCWRLVWEHDDLLTNNEKERIKRKENLKNIIAKHEQKKQKKDQSSNFMPQESQGSRTFFQQDSQVQHGTHTSVKFGTQNLGGHNNFQLKQGDFIVFYSKNRHEVLSQIEVVKRFKEAELLVDLDEFIDRNTKFIQTIPAYANGKNTAQTAQSILLNSSEVLQKLIKLFSESHYHSFKEITMKCSLNLLQLSPFKIHKEQEHFTKHKFALKLKVQGDINEQNQYFIAVDEYLKKHFRFSIIPVDEIRCCKLDCLNKYIMQDFDSSFVIDIHRGSGINNSDVQTVIFVQNITGNSESSFSRCIFKNQRQIANALRSKTWILIPNQQHNLDISISAQKIGRIIRFPTKFRDRLQQDQIVLQELKFYQSAISFKCDPQTYAKVLQSVMKFYSEMRIQEYQCDGFKQKPEFISHIFIKYFANDIQKHYGEVKFFISEKTGKLHRHSSQAEFEKLQGIIRQKFEQIIFNLKNFPTVSKIKQNPRIRQLKNPDSCVLKNFQQSFRYQFSQDIYINLLPYSSISSLTFNVCFIVDDQVDLQNSPFGKIAQENGRNPAKIIEKVTDESRKQKRKERVISLTIENSDFIRDAILWIIGTDRRFGRQERTENDCEKVFQDIQNYSNPMYAKSNQGRQIFQANFVFPNDNEDTARVALKKILQRLQNKAQEQSNSRKRRKIQANFYYHQECTKVNPISKKKTVVNVKNQLKRMVQNNSKRINLLYLNEERIQKVINMNFYKFTYYEEQKTKSLSVLNSFIFNYERSKNNFANKITPVVICKPSVKSQREWLFDLRNQVYFTIEGQMGIIRHRVSFNKLKHEQTKKIVRVIQKYFKNLQYFVLPIPKDINDEDKLTGFLNFYLFKKPESIGDSNSDQFLKRIKLNLSQQKIVQEKEQEYMIFHISRNNFVEWFLIESYTKELQEIKQEIKRERNSINQIL